MQATRTCSIDGCDRKHEARGLCHAHYERWRKTGTIGEPALRPHLATPTCTVEACERAHYARGWCRGHWERWSRSGMLDPTPIDQPLSETYNAVHWRVVAWRGKASALRCIDCAAQADQWSYNHSGVDEVEGPRFTRAGNLMLLRYSTSVDEYDPRCIGCHRAFDANYRRPL